MGYQPRCFVYYGYDIELSELSNIYSELTTCDNQDYYDIIYNIMINAGLTWDQYIIDPDWCPDYICFGEPLNYLNKEAMIKTLQNKDIENFYYDVYIKIMKKEPDFPIEIGYVTYMG